MIKILTLVLCLFSLKVSGNEVRYLLSQHGNSNLAYNKAIIALQKKALAESKSYIKHSKINSEGQIWNKFEEYQDAVIQLTNIREVYIGSKVWLYADYESFSNELKLKEYFKQITDAKKNRESEVTSLIHLKELRTTILENINDLNRIGAETVLLEKELLKVDKKLRAF
ncbi:MAG: hypothetical protein ACPGTQ_13575 [Colwellia sp.]